MRPQSPAADLGRTHFENSCGVESRVGVRQSIDNGILEDGLTGGHNESVAKRLGDCSLEVDDQQSSTQPTITATSTRTEQSL